MKMTKEDLRVLIADDDKSDLRGLRRKLNDIGYLQIQETSSAEKVLELSEDYKPNILVMDTEMARLKGYGACEKIRQTELGKNMVIIGLSRSDYEREWLNSGADAFLDKTAAMRYKDLEEAINQGLEQRQII